MEKWWQRARNVMRDKRVTQDELAARLEVTQGGLQHWLSGSREPSLERIDQIADNLGVPGSYLTHGVTADDLCTDLEDPARRILRRLIAAQRNGQTSPALWAAIEQVMDLAGVAKGSARPLGAPIAPEHEAALRERLEDGEREHERRQRQGRRASTS